MFRIVALIMTISLLIGCGAGFLSRSVEGTYEYNTKQFTYTCNDGSEGKNTAQHATVKVEKNDNTTSTLFENHKLIFSHLPGFVAPTFFVDIDRDGEFSFSKKAIIAVEFPEKTETEYSFVGKFNRTNWSGIVNINKYFVERSVMCTYESTFSGDQIDGDTDIISITEEAVN